MKELNTLVENYFTPALDATDILRLVEQIMDETPMIVSEAQEDIDVKKDMTIDDLLGSLSINPKAWGNPEQTDGDRAVIQNYASSLGLSNSNDPDLMFRTLGESFEQLQATKEGEENKCSLMKSLSIIQILNTMSRVMSDIGNASASGFVMEAFLSALFPNGKWESDASGMGLADFIIQGGEGSNDNLISLKTQKLGSMIGGSINNLLFDLIGRNTKSGGVVTYYVMGKTEEGKTLEVQKIVLTPEIAVKVGALTEWHVSGYIKLQNRISFLESEIPEMKEQWDQMVEDVPNRFPPDFDISLLSSKKRRRAWVGAAVRRGDYGEIPNRGLGTMIDRAYAEFEEEYAEVMDTYRNHDAKLKSYKKESNSMHADKNGVKTGKLSLEEGETKFYIDPNETENVATLNIDPQALYETANKSLKSIVKQLVQIQKDYRDTVREMHSYLSTLSNATAEGFKREVAEFDKSVQDNTNGTEGCDPDFVK